MITDVSLKFHEKRLGDLATYLNGRAFKPSEWKQTGLPIVRIQNLNKKEAEYNYSPEIYEDRYLIKNGDLLFAWSASLGAHIWKGGDAWLNQHIFKVVPKPGVDKLFLYYGLCNVVNELYSKTHGSGMVHVTKGKFEDTTISAPSITEQQRIVEKIEELFSELDAAMAGLKEAEKQLQTYRQSVLKYAFEGKFTGGMAGWEEKNFGQLIDKIEAGKSFRCNEKRPDVGEIGVLKVSAVTWGTYDESESKTVVDSSKINKRYFVKKGDFIFSRANTIELVGACVVAHKVTQPIMLSDKTLRIIYNNDVVPEFVLHFLRSKRGRKQIEELSTGNQESMRNIGQERMKQIIVHIPNPEIQRDVVNEIETRLSKSDQLLITIQQQLTQAEALRQSILQLAFRGELV